MFAFQNYLISNRAAAEFLVNIALVPEALKAKSTTYRNKKVIEPLFIISPFLM